MERYGNCPRPQGSMEREARAHWPGEGSTPGIGWGQIEESQETCPVLPLHLKGLEKVPVCRLPGPKGLNVCEPRSLARQTLLPPPG